MVESSGLLFATRHLGLQSKVEQQIVETKSDRFDLCVLQCHKERTEEKAKLSSPYECEPTGRASQEPALSKAGLGTEVGDVRIESRSIGSSVFFRLLKGTTVQGSSLKELRHKVRLLKATTVQGSSLKELQHVSSLKELQHKVRIYRNYSVIFVYKGTIAHVSSLNELIHQFHP